MSKKKKNPELQWVFSLVGQTNWRVIAYRRVLLAPEQGDPPTPARQAGGVQKVMRLPPVGVIHPTPGQRDLGGGSPASEPPCRHIELAWLWVHPKMPECFLHDTDAFDLPHVTEIVEGRVIPLDQAVNLLTSEPNWIVLDEPEAPTWVEPVTAQLREQLQARSTSLEQELRLVKPGSEQEQVLSQALACADAVMFTDIDLRNHACDYCT